MIQFLKTKGIAILGVFLVMSMFFINMNVMTAHALTNVNLRLNEDTVTQVTLSSENRYPLIIGNGYANLKMVRVDRPDLRFKVHNSSDVSVDFMVTQNVDSGFLIKTIGVGETYVFDIDFWNEYYDSLTPNQKDESLSTLYFCCSEDGTQGSLQVSYAGEEDNVFLSIMNLTSKVCQSLFELAGATVTFIFEHPLVLLGLLTGLIYTGILIFRLITKGV